MNQQAKERYDALLAHLIDASDEIHKGSTPEEMAAAKMALHHDIQTVRRRRHHERERTKQPHMQSEPPSEDFMALVQYIRQPLTLEDRSLSGLDLLAINVKEEELNGGYHNLVFALARFFRKAWGENRWGAIEAEVKVNADR